MPNTVRQTKLCPNCNEEIMLEAIKCKHCKSFIEETVEKTSNIDDSNIEPEPEIRNIVLKHSFDLINNNAYRVLGLPANCSQKEIHEANSSIRRVIKIGINKPSSWDLLWLGPINRTEKDLQSAIAKLTNPVQRLRERLFWISGNEDLLNTANIEALPTVIEELETIATTHDFALIKLAYANLVDPEIKNKSLWVDVIALWCKVIDSDDYWAQLLEIEMDGEFEPFATTEEVENLKGSVYKLICSGLLTVAHESIISGNDTVCRQVFDVLQASKLPKDVFYDFENQVLGKLEDKFTELCDEVRDTSNKGINRDNTKAQENIKSCTLALNRFDEEIQPFLNRIVTLSGNNSEITIRAKGEAATCLRGIAIDFTWADDFTRSQKLLERARTIAPKDSSIYHRILEDLCDVEKTSEKQKIWKDLQPIKSAPALQTINGVGFTLYGCTDVDPETNSYLATYYFVFFFIPIFPICRYRVISAGDRSYRFLGKAPLTTGHKWHIGISLFLMLVAFLWISASSPTSSSSYSSNYSSGYSSTPTETTNYSSTPSETYIESDSTSASTEPTTQDVQMPPEGILPGNQFGSIYKDELKAKIEAGRAKLTSVEASYNQLADEVQGMKLELNQKEAELATLEAQATNDTSIEDYETKRKAYNQLVEKHNQTLSRAKKAEQEYNALLEEDHKMVQEYNSL